MTGREALGRRARRITIAFYVGQGLFVCGVVAAGVWGGAGGAPPLVTAACGVGAAVACAVVLYACTIGLRCPWCRGDLSAVFSQWGCGLREARFCPYCGRDFDDAVPEGVRADASSRTRRCT